MLWLRLRLVLGLIISGIISEESYLRAHHTTVIVTASVMIDSGVTGEESYLQAHHQLVQ